jgi:hypothetical protein
MSKIELDPKCVTGRIKMALTNRGELAPCCYIDNKSSRNERVLQELLDASRLSEYNSIDEILETKAWRKLERVLLNPDGPWPQACVKHCQKRPENDVIKIEQVYSSEGSEKNTRRTI